jgi:anti-sigma regulatory factor (Ser/Thr protein kinase)
MLAFTYTTDLSQVRSLAEAQAKEAGLPDDRVVDFVLAVSEVAANTIRHARSPGSIRIWSDDQAITCEIRDEGIITDPLAGMRKPSPDATGGHGTIVRLHMDIPAPGVPPA